MRGATRGVFSGSQCGIIFQSTLLMRGATWSFAESLAALPVFQSTLLMRGATPWSRSMPAPMSISIHAPHARSDAYLAFVVRFMSLFQSTLLMRGATTVHTRTINALQFQSTLLMRGATASRVRRYGPLTFQSTLLMRGATQEQHPPHRQARNFNPRSSCEERPPWYMGFYRKPGFQSTLLMRGATGTHPAFIVHGKISIHAPHARSDCIAPVRS